MNYFPLLRVVRRGCFLKEYMISDVYHDISLTDFDLKYKT